MVAGTVTDCYELMGCLQSGVLREDSPESSRILQIHICKENTSFPQRLTFLFQTGSPFDGRN